MDFNLPAWLVHKKPEEKKRSLRVQSDTADDVEYISQLIVLYADRYGNLKMQPPAIHIWLDLVSLRSSESVSARMHSRREMNDLLSEIKVRFCRDEKCGYMIKAVLLLFRFRVN